MYAIKLNREVYDDAAKFAKSQNVSVEQFVETLIIKAVNEKPKFKYKSEDELSPLVIINWNHTAGKWRWRIWLQNIFNKTAKIKANHLGD